MTMQVIFLKMWKHGYCGKLRKPDTVKRAPAAHSAARQHGRSVIRPCWSACSRRSSCLNPSNIEGLHRLPEQNVTVSYSVITGVKLRFLTIAVPPGSCYKSLPDYALSILILQLLPQTSD